MNRPIIVALLIACGGTLAGAARWTSSSPTIPLCPGLTIVTAISEPQGDYESIKTIESVSPAAVQVTYSAEVPRRDQPGGVKEARIRRTVRPEDLGSATRYARYFSERLPDTIPGTTALGISRAVLESLKTTGEAELSIPNEGLLAQVARVNPGDVEFESQTIKRIGPGPVTLPVLVNDVRVELPVIRAQGHFFGEPAEFHFLDDPDNPIALQYAVARGELADVLGELTKMLGAATGSRSGAGGRDSGDTRDLLRVVRISHRCGGQSKVAAGADAPATGARTLETALGDVGRVEVYDIFFSFNSADLREESDPALKEIAELLAKHAGWKLSIEGHTDSIASDGFNLDLSRRRAAAVKDALVARYQVDASRLTTGGQGETRPRDTNDTLEGRARNRRVELVRLP